MSTAGPDDGSALHRADFLGTALERQPDITTAPARWEAELRPEVLRKQKLGRRVKGLYAPADSFQLWLRDLPLRTAALPPIGRLLMRHLQLAS